MLKLAEDEEWEEVVDLEEKRRQLIAAAFPLTTEQASMPSTIVDLERVIELDKQIMEMGVNAQHKMSTVLGKIQKGRQATTAYRKFAG
jgi:hypothetical protein